MALRFKKNDGSDFPEWEEKKLGDVCERISTKNTVDNQNVLTISAQQGLINQLDFFDKKVSSSNLKNYFLLKRDDFAYNKSYSKGYPFGAIKRLKFYSSGVVSPLYICFRTKKDNPLFLEYVFEGSLIDYEIQKIAQEGARNHGLLNISIMDFFDNISLKTPSIEEQEKIAGFLTAVDELIADLTKKESLLQKHKKGVMQKIFSQELRFKQDDGSDFPDWEEKKLGDIGIFLRGRSYSSDDVLSNRQGILVLRSNNIQDGNLSLEDDLQFVSKECNVDIILKKNDIVICMSNGSKHLVGKSAFYKGNFHYKTTVGAFCSIFRSNNSLVQYILKTNKYKEFLKILLAGSLIYKLKNSDLANLKFDFPTSLEEQQKIATCLSDLDNLIEQTKEKLKKYKELKKSLMQHLFK